MSLWYLGAACDKALLPPPPRGPSVRFQFLIPEFITWVHHQFAPSRRARARRRIIECSRGSNWGSICESRGAWDILITSQVPLNIPNTLVVGSLGSWVF